MPYSSLRSTLTRALGVLILTFVVCAPSHAIYVVGKWDPAYGSPFTNLGWRGEVKVDVPAACLAQPGPAGYPVAGLCAPVTVVDATVEFYDTTDLLQATIETLDFTASLVVTDVGLAASGVPLGIIASSGPVLADETALSMFEGVYAAFVLALDFTLDDGPSASLSWSVDASICDASPYLEPEDCSGVNSEAPVVSFSVVPEPGSLVLAGVAIGGLLLSGRRRGRAGGA